MKKKGNISILVIFVLLASSLLGILSMNFVQQMMKQSALVNSYYKAYYLAKGGLELGLVQITHRDVGFEYIVNTGDAIMSGNFLCGDTCSLTTITSGTSSLLSQKFGQGSGCEYPYILTGGGTVIIPLFRDITSGTIANTLQSGVAYENLANILSNINFLPSSTNGNVNYGILILSGDNLSQNGVFFNTGTLQGGLGSFKQAFEQHLCNIKDEESLYGDESYLCQWYADSRLVDKGFRMYLLISNSSNSEESFCISVPDNLVLPTDTFLIQSQATYGNQYVVLDASYAQPIPGFLFDTYSSF